MMNVKVSVVIPVYNAEKYITECIESLLNQTLKQCEFIFVNDGSKDNSFQIIENCRKKDNRVKLINQENQGVSIARNNGLEIALGEYVGFVDADDYIEKDMYETLYNCTKQYNYDLILSNFESEIEGHKVITKYSFPIGSILDESYIKGEILPYFLKADDLNTACNKLYRNKILKENLIRFPENVSLGEDGMFNISFIGSIDTMIYIDYTGYHYREVKGSATRNVAEKDYFQRALEVYRLELPTSLIGNINKVKIQKFKSLKLIRSVMSYIHVYFDPGKELSFKMRYRYIKEMIGNKCVKEALAIYCNENYNTMGNYEKFIINMIKRESTLGLYFATTYSRVRNK
ncbi:glycosyltransferase [Priestia megaterium]|uniref:glycosyltransferase n=1 Tax=Priestia megaterium TaxID=1404 RepID=UPI00210105ED|nr:glycosyltransferase [Priestia megaterium]